jgi:flagellar biosynthesis/type III secretory pathway protein FliH
MKPILKIALTTTLALANLMTGIAYATSAPAEQAAPTVAKLDCSRLPADATNEQLTLCLQSLRYEQSVRQGQTEKSFADGRRAGYDEGFRAGRSYSSGYQGGYGGD